MTNLQSSAFVAKTTQLLSSVARLRLLLVMLLTLTASTAWGQTWEKATSIATGDVVLLVCESKNMELSSISTTNTKYGIGVAYTTSPAGAYELTVEAGSSSGTYSLKNGSNYLYWNSGNSLATNATKSANTSWSITFSNGNATIKNAEDNSRIIGWNASSLRFACYTSSQTAVQLYKKVSTDPCASLAAPIVTTTNITNNSFTLSWNAVAGAESYNVYNYTTDVAENITTTSYTFTELTPNTEYEWEIETVKSTCSKGTTGTTTTRTLATITLSEAGATSNPLGVYYVGDTYELPSTTSQSCGTKALVGWSTVQVAETDAKPTSNYYELGEQVTLAASQTFYAVFATKETSGSGTADWNKVTTTSDLEAGATYAISNAATGGNYLSTYAGGNNFPNSTTTICKLVLGGSSNAWTFKINDASSYNNYYLTATSSTDKNYLKAVNAVDSYCKFTISFNSGKAIITCTGKNSRNVLQYNSNNNPPIFACYASGNQSAVYLQKYSTGATTTYSDYTTSCITETLVSLNPNGGTFETEPDGWEKDENNNYVIKHTGTEITLPTNISQENKNFVGWYNGETAYKTIPADLSESITLTAKWSDKPDPEIAWEPETCTVTIDAGGQLPTTFQNPNELTGIIFESSNSTVASVDNNGVITLGTTATTATVTITATFAGDATYAAKNVTCTLTVNPSNCRWVEIGSDATKIVSGSEVVITMEINGYLYALPNNGGDNAPELAEVTEEDILMGSVANTLLWDVEKAANNYLTFHPINSSDNLFFNKADDGVRIGSTQTNATISHEFIISNSHLANIYTSRYLGIGTVSGEQKWKTYTTPTGNLTSQTLRIFQRECLDPTEVWVEGNLTNVTCTQQLPQQLAKDGSVELIFTAADGYALPNNVTVSNATKTWDQATGALTISNPTDNVLVTINAVKLHTITWMVGSTSILTEEVANATGVTQTPADPANGAIGECANAFMGWSETPLGSTEGQSAPADLCTAAQMKSKHTSVTGDKTFYAVFATVEGSATDFKRVTSLDELSDGTSIVIASTKSSKFMTYSTAFGSSDWSESNGKITATDNMIFTLVAKGDTWRIQKGTNIVSYEGSATSSPYCKPLLMNSNIKDWILVKNTSTTNTFTFYYEDGDYDYAIEYYSNESNWYAYSNKAPTSNDYYALALYVPDVTYSNYVTNCCALAPATNLTVSGTTANSATLTWTAPSPTTDITKLQVRDGSGNVVVDNLAANTTSATISGLTECTSYQYYVVSVGEDCEVVSDIVTAQPYGGAKTVNYDYNGGSGSVESFTTSCDDDKREIILPVATRPGYTFDGWYDPEGNKVGDAGATYDPATSPITLYAHWTENIYQLTHSGSNYTNTENKTSIKSSDTPFALHYTCTGDYGLPATISITGGGKSWTIDTDYTWEVAADKQSATLTINQTTITADVTITINVATRYTVTFVHNDKGVFSGSEAIEVLSSENTITLPTVTDVSCGFYDTFEGWIVADEDYTESTSKPAGTIYKGGANYTINSDCTLRALYSKCEGDATQVYRKVTATGEVTDGTYILVATTTTDTSYVYSGNVGNPYGLCVSGLTTDDGDFSSTLPDGTDPISITVNDGKFAMYNANEEKYLTYTGSSNTLNTSDSEANVWKLTDGSQQINEKACPEGALTPSDNTRVLQYNTSQPRFACYTNNNSYPYVFLYKLIDKCTKYYSTNPSCEKPVGVHIVYNANAVDASMSCSTQDRTYKVENEVNKYPQLASQLQFCTNATREGYTLVGWNTQANGQGTTYNINQNYYNLPVSGELDGDKWITLNLYAMWKPCIKFNLGNATGGTGVPDAVVENGGCVLPTPTAEQLGTIPCGYEFYAWSETSVNATQTKPVLFMPGDTYTGSELTLYAVYRWCEGNTGSDTYYFTFNVNSKTYCITQKHNSYARFVVEEATSGLIFGLENGYLYYLDEGVKTFVYWEGDGTTVTTTTTYPNNATQKTTFVEGDNGTTIVTPAISGRYLQMPSSYTDRAYYTTDEINPTLVEVQTTTCTYATNPTCYTNTNLHFVTNGGTLNYPTDYDETNYQELAIGDDILLPTATFAGEWTFEGWKRGSQLESQTIKPYDPSFYPVTPNSTLFEVDELGDIYFYAVYSKTNDDKQFNPESGGTYKLYAIGADGTKTYMPIWTGSRGTPSGVTTCAESGDYTITPGAGTHAGQYQITCGEYTLGVVSGNTDLNEVEGTWWNIKPSTSGKGTWRITVVGSTDDRALICSFSTAKSFGNYAISNLNGSAQTVYRDMEIGECIYTEYTSTPENIPYITITGAPVKITSTNGERVYAPTTLHIEAHNFTGERIIHLSATNGFGVDPVQVRTNGQGAYSGDVKVYYEPTADGDGQTITTSVLTASQTGETNAEKINQTFAAIQGRNMPANFVIAAKWDGLWYALPANCTSSLSSTEGLLIEVNDVENPTMATSAPASAKYGLREVIPSRQTDYGQGIVFTERFAEGDKQFALYNGSNANIQVNAQYTNYAQTNPDKYEWIPSTSDFKDYTLTNASTGRNLGLTSGTFGAYTAASNQVRLLPATFYEPAPVQVLKWKENSVIVMYTGAEATATTQVGDNAQSAEQTLADQKLTHGIYELTSDQALTTNAGGTLRLYFGANARVELEIPLIISGEVTASANAHDVVILENSKLTAVATKYSYKDVYVYGGAKLAIPDGTELGVNNIILRAGAVATNGAGQEATYQYIYPQVELKGTLTSSVQNIRYEYVTDYDHWYHLVLPFDGSLTSIHYPTEYYGDQVKLDNTGSWQIKRYAGEIRATGNYDAWKDIETEGATSTTAGQGYIFWGAPKKITANDKYDRPTWGIQRITMLSDVSETISKAKDAENANKTISGLGSYKNVANNSGADNDQGWNLIGNPYMVNLTELNSQSLQIGQLIHETDASGNWTGKWQWDNTSEQTGLRYVTIPSDHFETYEAKPMTWFTEGNPMIAGRSFFVQIAGDATDLVFDVTKKAALVPALLAENNDKPVDIETGIVLSNETLQDEVNFWIKAGKTNDYEYNADYPKTPNNNQFNIYGVHTNGDLSWVATGPEYAAESMPIGYQVPAAGTYMLSLTETYDSNYLEALYVTDHEMSPEVTTDLMITSYEFSVNQAETNNKRFTVAIKLKNGDNNDATGLDNLGIGNENLIKFIYQDKMYILHHGVIYDATGKRVITINK